MAKFGKILLITVVALTSCAKLSLDPRQLVNESEFAKKVGGVDEKQTWNLAETKSVSVTASGPVRIYISDGKQNHLVADQIVTGTKSIKFDAPADVKNVTVVAMGGGIQTIPVGGSATFSSKGSKTVFAGDAKVQAQLINDYTEFSYATVQTDVATDAFTNVESSSELFYSETGEFILNPAWYTNETQYTGWSAQVGIYYYNESNEMVEVPIFINDRANEMVQSSVSWGTGWKTNSDEFPIFTEPGDFTGQVRSKGIKVTVPAKTPFGIYVSVGSEWFGGKFYSEGQYNTIGRDIVKDNPGPYISENGLGKYGHVALITVEGRKYLALDDWCELETHSKTNAEYRHLVFSINGDLTDDFGGDPIGEDGEWILACEDLGEGADYDFNDVVLGITHQAGSTEAEIKLLAAGATAEDVIFYKDQRIGEVHELFGVGTTTMVNTFVNGQKKAPASTTITVPADFSMSAEDMGGFKIVHGQSSSVIAAPGQGNVPYMICIPGTWKWPKEMTSIMDAYPQFSSWCNDHTQCVDWYKTCVEDKVYNKQ